MSDITHTKDVNSIVYRICHECKTVLFPKMGVCIAFWSSTKNSLQRDWVRWPPIFILVLDIITIYLYPVGFSRNSIGPIFHEHKYFKRTCSPILTNFWFTGQKNKLLTLCPVPTIYYHFCPRLHPLRFFLFTYKRESAILGIYVCPVIEEFSAVTPNFFFIFGCKIPLPTTYQR